MFLFNLMIFKSLKNTKTKLEKITHSSYYQYFSRVLETANFLKVRKSIVKVKFKKKKHQKHPRKHQS